MLDLNLHDNRSFREDLFQYVYDVYNNGLHIDDEVRAGKLMLLSKTGEPVPDPMDTRPIVLLTLRMKVIQAVFLFIMEETIMSCIPEYQLGFRKGASTELQLCRFIDHLYNADND
jgi:hypothetical protein